MEVAKNYLNEIEALCLNEDFIKSVSEILEATKFCSLEEWEANKPIILMRFAAEFLNVNEAELK
jgi:hypothetical protein